MLEPPEELTRRSLLGRVAAALGGFLAAAIGVPLGAAALAPATKRSEPQWIRLGQATDFESGRPRMVSFGVTKKDGYVQTTAARAVWVCRFPGDRTTVYSARCTHLGCLVNHRPDSRTFVCPCHGGVFALEDGGVLDGPPPRALDQLVHEVQDGQLRVQYRDFLAGVSEQIPL